MAETPDITHRRILTIALPIVLSNATVPILGAVDAGVVGQLGLAAPIGAVGMGAIILSTFYWIFGFLRMGTSGLAGQAKGAGDAAETSAILTRALVVAMACGLFLIVFQRPLFWGALALSPASPEVEALTSDYLRIRIWGAPFAISVYVVTGWLVAMQKTAGVFWVQLIMNGLNIVLDLWFVLGLGWGVDGVAVATVIAEVTGTAVGLWYCRQAFYNREWRNWLRVFEPEKLRRMALLNFNILIRSAISMSIFTSFLFVGASFGDVTLAANEVLLKFVYITAFAMDGFTFAAQALVSQYIGQKDPAKVHRAAKMCWGWGVFACVLQAAFFALAGPWLIDLMAKSAEVQIEARTYLFWMVLAPILGCTAWMLDGIFVGATRGRDMRNMMALSGAIYVVALLALVPPFGNHGVWAALVISFVSRGVTLGAKYPALLRSAKHQPEA